MKENLASVNQKLASTFFLAFLMSIFFAVLVRTAWLCDDAYITFRTIDNFFHGYGLCWNTSERVQAYTHPLWLLLIACVHLFTREFYYSAIGFSILLTLLGAGFLVFRLSVNTVAATLVMLLLILSKAFTDFSTSGLENPLSHVLLILFFGIYFLPRISRRESLLFSFIAVMVILNRMDLLLIVAPAWFHGFFTAKEKPHWKILVLTASPLLLWELFSLWYYGFPFPNTAYAKLFADRPFSVLLESGITYFIVGLNGDPLTILTILTLLFTACIVPNTKVRFVALGVLLYLGYILKIGGDFMAGRFFAAPFICAVIVTTQIKFSFKNILTWFLLILLLVIGLSPSSSPPRCGADYGAPKHMSGEKNGIIDERAYYYPHSGLLNIDEGEKFKNYEFAELGRGWRNNNVHVAIWPMIGFAGFYAGPELHLIDLYALADPLLARLPTRRDFWIRVGHYTRILPEGYYRTIESGEMQFRDKNLQEYYQHLRLITQGSLWSPSRLLTIVKMNLGFYNHLIDRNYYRRQKTTSLTLNDLSKRCPEGLAFDHEDTFIIPPEGIEIRIDPLIHNRRIDVSLDHNDEYRLVFFQDRNKVGECPVPKLDGGWGLHAQVLEIPSAIAENGYNRVRVEVVPGDTLYSIGHFIPLENE